jgi:hypothetical protein
MSAVALEKPAASIDEIHRYVAELAASKAKLARLSLSDRVALLQDCLERVVQLAPEWVEAACQAKGLAAYSPLRAEEIAAGPVSTARHLRLLIQNFEALERTGHIPLPAEPKHRPDGSLVVQVMPVKGLFDSLVFAGFRAESWLDNRIRLEDLNSLGRHVQHPGPAKIVLVLGAGNVSSIPATDTISKIFQ